MQSTLEYPYNWTASGYYGTATNISGNTRFNTNAMRPRGTCVGSNSWVAKFTVDTTSMGANSCFMMANKTIGSTETWPAIYKNSSGTLCLGLAQKSGIDTTIWYGNIGDFKKAGNPVTGPVLTVTLVSTSRSYTSTYSELTIIIQDSAGVFYSGTAYNYYSTTGPCLMTSNSGSGTVTVSPVKIDYGFVNTQAYIYGWGFVSGDTDHPQFKVLGAKAYGPAYKANQSQLDYYGTELDGLAYQAYAMPQTFDAAGQEDYYKDGRTTYVEAACQLQMTNTNAATNPSYTIRYTTDGTKPTSSSTLYTAPVNFAFNPGTTTIVRAQVFNGTTAVGLVVPFILFFPIEAPTVSFIGTPTFAGSSMYASDVTASISCATPGTTIRYTTDGTAVNASSPVFTGSFVIPFGSGSQGSGYTYSYVRAIAYAGANGSQESWTAAQFAVAANETIPQTQESGEDLTFTLSSPNTNVDLYYTLDGTDPTTSSTKAPSTNPPSGSRASFTIPWQANPLTVKVKFIHPATGLYSPVQSSSIKFVVPSPVINPQQATSTSPQAFNLSSPQAYTSILYTLDGSNPTQSSPSVPNPGSVTLKPGQVLKACTSRNGLLSSTSTAHLFAPSRAVKAVTLAHASKFYHFYETRQELRPDPPYTQIPSPPSLYDFETPTNRFVPRFLLSQVPTISITTRQFDIVRLPSQSRTRITLPVDNQTDDTGYVFSLPQEDTLFAIESYSSFQIHFTPPATALVPAFSLAYSPSTTQVQSTQTYDLLRLPSQHNLPTPYSQTQSTFNLKFPHRHVSTNYNPSFTIQPYNITVTLTPQGPIIDSTQYPPQPYYDITFTSSLQVQSAPYIETPPQQLPIQATAILTGTFTIPSYSNPIIRSGTVLNTTYPETTLSLPPSTTGLLILDPATQSIIIQPNLDFVPTSRYILALYQTTNQELTSYYNLLSSSLIRVRAQDSKLQGGTLLTIASNLALSDDHVSTSNGDFYPSDLRFRFPKPNLTSQITIPISIQSTKPASSAS